MDTHTITVRTLDAGTVDVAEPAWCLGEHPDDGYLADVVHDGVQTPLTFRGYEALTAGLTCSPYSEVSERGLQAAVEMGDGWLALDPAGLDSLASALVEHASELRALARQLSALLAAGEVAE
ncbi:DUF6907 domain-containing protein [Streptomyces roseifaciens]